MKYGLGVLLVFLGLFSSCGLAGLARPRVERLVSPSVAMAQGIALSLPRSPGADNDSESARGFWEESDVSVCGDDGDPFGDTRPDYLARFSESTRPELWPEQLTGRFQELPGEFQHQAALFLGCRELLSVAPDVLVGIVDAACGQIPILALVADDDNRDLVLSTLETHGLASDSVYFLHVPHNTMWIRDYGPVVTTTSDGSEVVLDAEYGDEERPDDDEVPGAIARLFGAPRLRIPLEVDGGNLITNGDGLCLSTVQLIVDNDVPEPHLRRMLKIYYGCDQTVFLEPLIGEETGHIDMFATFTSSDTVVVGQYADDVDDQNRSVLDRNVETLSRVQTARGRLHVVRIPMPDRSGGQWRTYTNVIYANGALLVPVYSDDDRRVRARVLSTFSRLLPSWDVVALEADTLTGGGGALHCVSRNVASLGAFGRLKPSECEVDDIGENAWVAVPQRLSRPNAER